MGEKEDHLFGRLALRLRLITPQQLNECLSDQKERGAKGLRAPLGVVLRDRGYLSDAQVTEILQKQRGTTRRFQAIGPYLIERKLGDGPMGIVYRAVHRTHQRYVALRVLPGRLQREPEVLRQVRERLEAVRGLSHPNLVAVEDVGEASGFHYAASEWVEGESLAAVLAREEALEEVRALRIAYEISAGLQILHARRLVHRALRPENVFLDGTTGRARLADFGLLRLDLEERLGPSVTGALGGTTEYVAPELAGEGTTELPPSPTGLRGAGTPGGSGVDVRSDLYSLGGILFRMTAGGPPYTGATPREILERHRTSPIPSPRARRPELSEGLDRIVRKLLAKDPAERHPSPSTLMRELLVLLPESEMATLPRPPAAGNTTFRRLKPVHRRWEVWALLGAAAAGLAGLAAWLIGRG